MKQHSKSILLLPILSSKAVVVAVLLIAVVVAAAMSSAKALLNPFMKGWEGMSRSLVQNMQQGSSSSSSLLSTSSTAASSAEAAETSSTTSSSTTTFENVLAGRNVPDNLRTAHLVVLVHGWMGNPQELGYLKDAMERENKSRQGGGEQQQDTDKNANSLFLVHSATCNHGKTFDGIAAGGKRLADEVNSILESLSERMEEKSTNVVTLSFVGNSLGGLYAR